MAFDQSQNPGPRQRPGVSTTIRVALSASAAVVCDATPRQVQSLLLALESAGDIVQDLVPEAEVLPLVDEDEMDLSGVDVSDEDEFRVEPDVFPQMPDGSGPFSREDFYVIEVRRDANGDLAFVIPETGGEAYRALTSLGEKVLGNLTRRQRVYMTLADWLRREHAGLLGGTLDDFLDSYRPMTQRQFLNSKRVDCDTGTFSKFLNNASIALGGESMPLRRLFS